MEVKEMKFSVRGQLLTADELTLNAPKRVAKRAEQPDEYHKGWRVEGHKPGALEAARDLRADQIRRWAGYKEQQRKDAKARGEKEPKAWDEDQWRRNTKTKAVRSKAYEIPEAATECAELARKAGWLDVVVLELKRES